ncbi:ABC transporter substrate-binding protein [Fodinibius sediminis]|uniref:Iron complex transport system substrate-binding protein n=1 Tax=Fodinibius sediminis TaxID=1214077 RepID=A0A521B7W4_9BACT|nr:ABC transporter substrate-binding protein [Fodinibius sediminis]SMO43187.1 iron complex transport system substrate-binding protein [Fodinibius sediminis]
MSPRRLLEIYLHFRSIILISFIGVTACAPSSSDDKPNNYKTAGDAAAFPHKVQAEYAEGFRISYHQNYKLLEILKPFQDKVDTIRYSLVQKELEENINVNNTYEIAIPVQSMIATSVTHIALTDMLKANDILAGVTGGEYVYNRKVRQRIRRGATADLPGGELNMEKVLELNPDLLMISGGQSSELDKYRVLMDAGIDLVVNAEWLETTPLGKAEWVKVLAALLNKEELANRKFEEVARRYHSLKDTVNAGGNKPLVINNMPYKGTWFVPGGGSFTARYLKDAGAAYPWSDSAESGGLRKAFEAVYEQGLKADIWLNPGSAKTREAITARDERFRDFKPFRRGEIYHNYRRSSESGANDYWEKGVVRPDVVLADLIKIFHPGTLPDHELYFYQQVK